jgi:CII-binding regulator of phage lambda lysogenization HflD
MVSRNWDRTVLKASKTSTFIFGSEKKLISGLSTLENQLNHAKNSQLWGKSGSVLARVPQIKN